MESCAGTGPVGSIPPFLRRSGLLDREGAREVVLRRIARVLIIPSRQLIIPSRQR